ncbi:MAG: radical SAM protein [SAR324 cluster bacterium]|uniref:Radical SAM protein n=1 Tax=SAR324 cluster bacterium TaxID=2024889 RepID=A0A2A4SPF3_9DELT|nr:MAG: radical SAM protein [SAR324 cluster bacterium]
MFDFPIHYDEPLFRPPSEANSLILQVTLGCSWNRCSFCEMYKSKQFRVRKLEDIFQEIELISRLQPKVRKVFLGDGDAMVLPTSKLLKIIEYITTKLPKVQRISSYALPGNILRKSSQELQELREAGLKLIYMGIESGDDEILKKINKGETKATTIEGLQKAHAAGITSSVMILNGLGGARYSRQHAIHSAEVLNATQPRYASTLVLSFPLGEESFRTQFGDDFEPLTQQQLFEEMRALLEHTELKNTVFRSDHASNYLILKGQLGRDKNKLLEQLSDAIEQPSTAGLRAEWMRGL